MCHVRQNISVRLQLVIIGEVLASSAELYSRERYGTRRCRPRDVMKKLLMLAAVSAALAGCQKQSQPTGVQTSTGEKPSAPSALPAASTSAKTYDGPFGLASALTIADLERLGFKGAGGTSNLYFGTPPKPLPDAGTYAVVATPGIGACRIIAKVDIKVVNDTGDQLKEKTDQLAELMAMKYGKYSDKVDYIKQDVYRRNPQFWMMGLKEESILYAYDWSAGKTDKPLPGDLENIEIGADADTTSSGYVTIKYTFKNFSACRKEMDTRKADSL